MYATQLRLSVHFAIFQPDLSTTTIPPPLPLNLYSIPIIIVDSVCQLSRRNCQNYSVIGVGLEEHGERQGYGLGPTRVVTGYPGHCLQHRRYWLGMVHGVSHWRPGLIVRFMVVM